MRHRAFRRCPVRVFPPQPSRGYLMNDLMLARTQRVLDQLPRPPSELPPGHPMRMLHEALENAYEARDFAEDVQEQSEQAWAQKDQVDDEIAELKNTMDEMK